MTIKNLFRILEVILIFSAVMVLLTNKNCSGDTIDEEFSVIESDTTKTIELIRSDTSTKKIESKDITPTKNTPVIVYIDTTDTSGLCKCKVDTTKDYSFDHIDSLVSINIKIRSKCDPKLSLKYSILHKEITNTIKETEKIINIVEKKPKQKIIKAGLELIGGQNNLGIAPMLGLTDLKKRNDYELGYDLINKRVHIKYSRLLWNF